MTGRQSESGGSMVSDSIAMKGRAVELHPGDVLGRYELLIPVGSGGMGQVWAARLIGSRGFQKVVALKTLLPCDDIPEHHDAMLMAEASLASRIRHPNVAETLDLGEQGCTLYLVMEWLDGQSLDRVASAVRTSEGLPLQLAVQWITQACRGLQAVHEATDERGQPLGLVHRDISPHNLLITYSGVLKVIDFGVAKATFRETSRTAVGQVKGKFGYMAPEQVQSEPIDGRADLFALGVVLYSLTVGRHPFKGDTPAATVWNVLTANPEPPSAIVPDYPRELEAVVMRALAKNREARFESAREMCVELERAFPPATEACVEQKSQQLLQELFAEEIAERTELLRGALEAAHEAVGMHAAPPAPCVPQAHSTMRAVAISSGPGVPAQDALPKKSQRPSSAVRGSSSRSRRTTLILAAACAPLGFWGLQGVLARGVASTGSVALAAEVPPGSASFRATQATSLRGLSEPRWWAEEAVSAAQVVPPDLRAPVPAQSAVTAPPVASSLGRRKVRLGSRALVASDTAPANPPATSSSAEGVSSGGGAAEKSARDPLDRRK